MLGLTSTLVLRYEKDYFHEALHKRLLTADTPPYDRILLYTQH